MSDTFMVVLIGVPMIAAWTALAIRLIAKGDTHE